MLVKTNQNQQQYWLKESKSDKIVRKGSNEDRQFVIFVQCKRSIVLTTNGQRNSEMTYLWYQNNIAKSPKSLRNSSNVLDNGEEKKPYKVRRDTKRSAWSWFVIFVYLFHVFPKFYFISAMHSIWHILSKQNRMIVMSNFSWKIVRKYEKN